MRGRNDDADDADDAEEDWDSEDPDEADQDESDDPELVPCPYCREEISEEADLCPHCGNYLSREDAPRRRPWFLIGVLVLVAAIFVTWVMKGF